MKLPDTYRVCGAEPPIRDVIDSEYQPDGKHALALNRAQRRGVPVTSRAMLERVNTATRPEDLIHALVEMQGYAATMRKACMNRGWPGAANHWRGVISMAYLVMHARRGRKNLAPWIEGAERAMYRAANASGESGGRARSRRKRGGAPV